jgi:23S rRNA (adenine2503-C2)-methyltransferase
VSALGPGYEEGTHPVVRSLKKAGFEVVVSIGEPEENALGSNCGQVLALWKKGQKAPGRP